MEKRKMIRTILLSIAIALAPLTAFAYLECDPKANVTTINGVGLPGKMATLVDSELMIDTIIASGERLTVEKAVRKAGTRVGIHVHKYGGWTCVLEGAMTDFAEGKPPMYFPAGTCYYMPPNTPMSTSNMGSVDAVIQDTFITPVNEPSITIIEPNYPGCK